MGKTVTLFLSTSPYSYENTLTTTKLAEAALAKGHTVNLIASGDGVYCFLKERRPKKILKNKYVNIILSEYFGGSSMVFRKDRTEVLRVIAHPVRMRILEELTKGVKCVSDLEDFLEISQPNVSQHLSLLRRYDLIDYYMDGRLRCYFLKDPLIPDLIELLKKHYEEELPAPACCPATKKGIYPGNRHR